MDNPQAQAAEPKSAEPKGSDSPQIDTDNVTLEQADQLFQKGSAELPVKSDGKKESGKEAAASPTKSEEPAKKEEPKKEEPAKAGAEPPKADEVVETRSQEEIDADVEAAVQKVKDDGGDEDAQNAAAEAARQPKTEEPEPEAAAKKEPEPKKEPEEKSRRFRVKDPVAQAALELYKAFENTETPITLAEAERRVRGGEAPKKEEPKVEEPDLPTIVSTLEGDVAELKRKLDEAGAQEDGALFNKEISQWTQELTEKTADLKLAKRDLKDAEELAQADAEEADAKWKESVGKSRAKAIEVYPAVDDEATPLGKAVAERIVAMRDKSHPDHNLLFSASCPEIITRTVADELGIEPVKAKAKKEEAPSSVKKTEIPPKVKKVEPASGAKSAAGSAPTPEDAKKRVEYLKTEGTLEELDEVFDGKDPLSRLANRAA